MYIHILQGPARARPAAALGPRPGSRAPTCENNMKIIWNKYENDVISQFHIIFTFYSYYFHIFITFLGSGPRSGPQKSYFCHIPGHIFFILFSYFCENLVFQPLHTDNLYKTGGQAGPAAAQGPGPGPGPGPEVYVCTYMIIYVCICICILYVYM